MFGTNSGSGERAMKRRGFMKMAALGAAASALGTEAAFPAVEPKRTALAERKTLPQSPEARVALVKGSDRREIMLKALEIIEPEIRKGVGSKKVVIKPNFTRVKPGEQLASTHVDGVSALCEVLSSFYSGKIIIAEGTGPGTPVEEALESYHYLKLKEKYNVEFFDLRSDDYTMSYILDKDIQPIAIRTSKLMLDPDVYLISAACLKTHSLAVVTLGLKNVVMAAPMKFSEQENDRALMHKDRVSADPRYFNFNLFQMAQLCVPDLVTVDGFVGMEGDGPLSGDPVESGIALAGTDWLAADRVGTEVMGFDFDRVGHLRFCAEARMGEANLSKIKVIGNSINECTVRYAPPPSMQRIIM